jgi:ribosomal protein S18 acetylase RimI-like enzyme
MNNDTPAHDLLVEHHDQADALALADELGALYAAAYVGTPQGEDPFYSAERFAERLAGYIKAPGFALVIARDDAELIGYAFGYLLPTGARWWDGLLDPTEDSFTTETGSRTFALCELHVRADLRGHGVASTIHTELVTNRRHTERATVLVRPDNPALALYQRWGYQPVGRLKPYPDSPTYTALVLPLA